VALQFALEGVLETKIDQKRCKRRDCSKRDLLKRAREDLLVVAIDRVLGHSKEHAIGNEDLGNVRQRPAIVAI